VVTPAPAGSLGGPARVVTPLTALTALTAAGACQNLLGVTEVEG